MSGDEDLNGFIGLTATLTTPADWHHWDHLFRLVLHTYGLWEHIIEKKPLVAAPEFPDIRKQRYTKTATALAGLRPSTPNIEGEKEEEQIDIQEKWHGEWWPSDLTEGGQKLFDSDLNYYQMRESRYIQQQSAREKLLGWILSTVARDYVFICCGVHEEMYEWYENLRGVCGPTNEK